MAVKRSGLGRGLDALIRDPKAENEKKSVKTRIKNEAEPGCKGKRFR